MFATIALLLATAAPAAPPPRCAAASAAGCIEGSWTGAFLGADWTFELKRANGVWTGRYITTRGKSWQPLLGLLVTDGAVSFGIESRPKLTFRLALDRAADTLAGAAEPEGQRPIPFIAARRP